MMTIDHDLDEVERVSDGGTNRGNAGRVLTYLVRNRGVMISTEDGARDTRMSVEQFVKAVSYLVNQRGARIDRPALGFVVFHRMPEEDISALRRRAREEPIVAPTRRDQSTNVDKVQEVFRANPGRTMTIEAIAETVGCAYNTVIQTVHVMRNRLGWKIQSPIKGAYLWVGDDVATVDPPMTTAAVATSRPAKQEVVVDGTGLLPGWSVVGLIDALPVLRSPAGDTYRLVKL